MKEQTPISQLFVISESKIKDADDFNTVSWLETLEDNDLERILKCGGDFFLEFNSSKEDFTVNDLQFSSIDYLTLCLILGEKETGISSSDFSIEQKQNCLEGLIGFCEYERLRRKGLVEFVGSKKISYHSETDVNLTRAGKVVASSLDTLEEISGRMEPNV